MAGTRKWLIPGIALGLGAPILVVVGLSIAFGLGFAFELGLLPTWIGGTSARWILGLGLALVGLWFLLRACVRSGGKRALWSGVAIYIAGVVVLGLSSGYLQSQQLDNPTAGVGFTAIAIFLAAFLVPLVAMGLIALRTTKRRQKANRRQRG
ncbi:MAG: hypothetical protein HGA39_08975 [Coriobacteriia bacterium]|nr:hypothetical protein [Coriobacteriia bacterium]